MVRSPSAIVFCFPATSVSIVLRRTVTFDAKLAELSSASANSFNVSRAIGALSTKLEIALSISVFILV